MKIKRFLIFLAIIILLIDLAYFYPKLTGTGKAVYEIKTANLTRAIDGDTIETDIGIIRLLGINTPEKKQAYYEEAKEFLKEYEGKEVEIEIHEKDKYNRTLGYIYFDNILLNQEILQEGLANLYVYEKDKYTKILEKAEQEAMQKEKGIWKKSGDYGCIEIVTLKYTEEERCNNQEKLVLDNKCNSMNIVLKDSANHIYKISLEKGIFSKNFSCVWNDDGDALLLRDDEGLVGYYAY